MTRFKIGSLPRAKHFVRHWTCIPILLVAESCALPEYTKDLPATSDVAGNTSGGNAKGGSRASGGRIAGGGRANGGNLSGGVRALNVNGGGTTSTSQTAGVAGTTGNTLASDGGTTLQAGASQGGSNDFGGVTSNGASGGVTTGGNAITGGSVSVAGHTAASGASNAGGIPNSGGFTSTGGTSIYGGSSNSAGQSTIAGNAGIAGANTGGVTATGGVTGTGGSTIVCDTGYASCQGICDKQISSDIANCGSCGNQCVGKQANWRCAYSCIVDSCTQGWGNCNTVNSDGCEVNFALPNQAHCGQCNSPCVQTICGNNDGAETRARCYDTEIIGRNTEYPIPVGSTDYSTQGFKRKTLYGVRRPIGGGYSKPDVLSMGVVEAYADSKYYVGIYASDANLHPAERLWVSPLQTSQPLGTAKFHVNEIWLDTPIRLEKAGTYWLMLLVYDPEGPNSVAALSVSTAGPDSLYGLVHFMYGADTGYGDVSAMPSTLLDVGQYSDISAERQNPAIFIRLAHP